MGALSVVLLAEGSGEAGTSALRGPDSPLPAEDWGAGHVLMARAIEFARGVPRPAIRFLEPRRTTRSTLARGSQLHNAKTLRQLINYLPKDRPELLIVLVDADGELGRKAELENAISDMPGTKIVACAIQEFESWLVSDVNALKQVLSADPSTVPSQPERLARNEAKEFLKALSSAAQDPRRARIALAEQLDLATLVSRCPSFAACLSDLKTPTH